MKVNKNAVAPQGGEYSPLQHNVGRQQAPSASPRNTKATGHRQVSTNGEQYGKLNEANMENDSASNASNLHGETKHGRRNSNKK